MAKKKKENTKEVPVEEVSQELSTQELSTQESQIELPPGVTPESLGIKPVKEYYEKIKEKYYSVEQVKERVHQRADISNVYVMKLNFWKRFNNDKYLEETKELIQKFAYQAREDTLRTKLLNYKLHEADKIKKNVSSQEEELHKIEEEKKQAEMTLQNITSQTEAQKREAKQNLESDEIALQKQLDASLEALNQKYNTEDLIQQQLEELINSSDLLLADPNGSGNFIYDTARMMEHLEDNMLNDVVKEMGPGKTAEALIRSLKIDEKNLIYSHQDEISDLSELGDIDWGETMIRAAEHGSIENGFLVPKYSDLVVDKYKPKNAVEKGHIDTAISLDISGSMTDFGKWPVAQKTVYALHSLLRRMNPENETYMSVYADELTPDIDTHYIYKDAIPEGSTATTDALSWLYDTLKDKPFAMAYLLTDGLPNEIEDAVKAAKKFRDHSNVVLRLFYITSEDDYYFQESKDNIKRMGKAAGLSEKEIIFVDPAKLAGAVIGDVGKAIRKLGT